MNRPSNQPIVLGSTQLPAVRWGGSACPEGHLAWTVATSKGVPCWQVVMRSFWNFPVTTTDVPTGAVAVSTPIRLASTAPPESVKTRQPASTPSVMVPVSSVALPPAPDEPVDGLLVATELVELGLPEVDGLVDVDDAVPDVEDPERLDEADVDAGGVDGSDDPQAETTRATRAQHAIARTWRTGRTEPVDAVGSFTRRTLMQHRSHRERTTPDLQTKEAIGARDEGLIEAMAAGSLSTLRLKGYGVGDIQDVRELASTLPRSVEAVVRDRVKFRVGRIVYLAFSRDESLMGFAFPKEVRNSMLTAEPDRYVMPATGDLRYNWLELRLGHFDRIELHEIVLDAWQMVVPKSVAAAYFDGRPVR